MKTDEDHLRLLSVFHYVVGGLAAFFGCIPIIHLVIGILIVTGAMELDAGGNGPPASFGWIFVAVGGIAVLIGWTMAVCVLMAGRCLSRRTHYMFCLVMGGVECLFMPFGTVLGVFTIIVLMREGVKELFTRGQGIPPT